MCIEKRMFVSVHSGKKILASKVKVCDTVFSRTLGLMFRFSLSSFDGVLLVAERESIAGTSIHSFFVFFPFDVFWLNKKKEVVHMQRVKPFQSFISSPKDAKYVLELSAGQISSVSIGDKISF